MPMIRGVIVPGGDTEVKMSAYADDNTGIFIDDSSMSHFSR